MSMITTQVVFELPRSSVISEVAAKIMLVASAEELYMDTVDVSDVGSASDVDLALVN
jgi:hypothetical protein